jgi:hypothetical protein
VIECVEQRWARRMVVLWRYHYKRVCRLDQHRKVLELLRCSPLGICKVEADDKQIIIFPFDIYNTIVSNYVLRHLGICKVRLDEGALERVHYLDGMLPCCERRLHPEGDTPAHASGSWRAVRPS